MRSVPLRSGCCHWPCVWQRTLHDCLVISDWRRHVLAGDVHRLSSPALKFIVDFIASQNHKLLLIVAGLMGTCIEKLCILCLQVNSCILASINIFLNVLPFRRCISSKALFSTLITRTVSLKQPWVKCYPQGQCGKRADLWSQYDSRIWVTLTWAWTCQVSSPIP